MNLTEQERRELLNRLANYVLDYDRLADLLAVAAGRMTREDADVRRDQRTAEYAALVARLADDGGARVS